MKIRRAVVLLMFAAYVLFLLDLALLQFPARNPAPNFVPLRSIVGDWRSGGREFVVNSLGNIVAFLPIGMIPRLARPRCSGVRNAAVFSLSLSVMIESVQYITGRRVADVDDLILNTLGGVLGYCASRSGFRADAEVGGGAALGCLDVLAVAPDDAGSYDPGRAGQDGQREDSPEYDPDIKLSLNVVELNSEKL